MQTLQAYFDEQGNRDIHALGQYIQRHVDQHWDTVFNQIQAEMVAKYDEIGDAVYGLYGAQLFKPVHDQLKAIGWKAAPRIPGSFADSREWGDDDTDRQRWFWTKITGEDRAAVGTIATIFYHDHITIRILRPFQIIALDAIRKSEVVAALSALSPDFAQALEARDEYAEYYAGTVTETEN